ncbi:uncharacterized protein LOC132130803 [Carassius carassius]|uniref:uncharacterized protein LOC132130803 n=1 Tax=Carassius carassius TaxID=217509 RepID=UPI002868E59E|nr:uncharacterized protein LOC132130803 [Carassius carassius]
MEMDQVTERLVEEVRKYSHLYDSSSAEYKDCQMAANSWREISSNVGLDVADCMKRWKNCRDKYVRLRKKLATRSGDPGGKKVPAFYLFLSWLAPHVKHRLTESNFDDKDGSDSSSNSNGSAVVRPSANNDQLACPPSPQPSLQSPQPSLQSPQISLQSPQTSLQPPQTSLQSPQTSLQSPQTSLQSPQTSLQSPSPRMAQKRKRKEQEDWVQMQVARLEAQLEERRVELQQRLSHGNDESDRFGHTVADMLRRVPEEHRAQAMFDVSKVLFEWQQKK